MTDQEIASIYRSALYVAALVIVSGCSASSDIEGESFTNADGSESVFFRDEKQVEVTQDGLVLQGEYSIEDNSRIRLVVDFMGAQIVGYGTMNDDEGFTLSMDGSAPTRYFSTEDPKLLLASREGEMVFETEARFCEEGSCPAEFMLSRPRDLTLSTVSLSIGDSNRVMFSKIEEVRYSDSGGKYGAVVRIKGGGSAMFGGWQSLHFSNKSDRDTFYRELVASVSTWHSTYGVEEFTAAEVPGLASQPSEKAVTESVESNDPLLGVWELELDGHRLEIAFAPDKTVSFSVDNEPKYGTYKRTGDADLELVIYDDSDDEYPDGGKFRYRLQDRSLTMVEISQKTNEPRPGRETWELVKSETPVAASLKWPQKSPIQQSAEDQVREGLNLSSGAKAAVSEYILSTEQLPRNNSEAGVSGASAINGKFVSSVEVKNGTIIVTYGIKADPTVAGNSIYLVPDNSNRSSISWKCYSDLTISRYAPAACADPWTAPQISQTAGSASTPSVQERTRSEPATSTQRRRRSQPATSDSSGPVLLFSVPPKYPARAQSRGMEGTVQVQYSIGADGKTKDVIVLQSSSSMFERAAIASILERRYQPPGRVITGLKDEVIFKLD